MMNKEIRNFEAELRIEKREGKQPLIIGHAAVYDSLSENLGGFREKIQSGAFDKVLDNDVRSLFNHDSNLILGRTRSKTLELSTDERGLMSKTDPPKTTYAIDLAESILRGDVSQMSFGFTVKEDRWDEDEDGRIIRTILEVDRLYDISAVTFPAYPDTDVAMRGLETFRKDNPKTPEIDPEIELKKKKLNNDKERKLKLLNLISKDYE